MSETLKPRTVLVVDDEEHLREAISFDFLRRDFKVITAACGNDALTILAENNDIDLVVSDVRMPNGNGLQLLEAIKAKDLFRPAVIFITGFADITVEEAYDLGADAVFPKPYDRHALQEAVAGVLQPADARFNRKSSRVDLPADGKLRLSSSGILLSRILNLGRGGFYAAIEGKAPAVGDTVDFSFNFEDNSLKVSGTGIVRWVRSDAGGPGQPAGCGVEFLQIDKACRKKFLELINFRKTKAFIPSK